MADWQISPEGAQAAKEIASGGLGTMTLIYLRHPGTILRAGFLLAIGLCSAWLLTGDVSHALGLPAIPTAYAVGLLGKAAAEGLLKMVENVDFARLLQKGV